MDIVNIGGAICLLAAVIAAIGTIWAKLIRPSIKNIRKVGKMIDDVETVPELHTKVDSIQETLARLEPMISGSHYQLFPNSGSSMNDKLTRLDDALSEHLTDPAIHAPTIVVNNNPQQN